MEDMDVIKGRGPRKKTCPMCDFNTLNLEGENFSIYPCHHCGYILKQKEIHPPRIYDGVEYEPGTSDPYEEKVLKIRPLPSLEEIKRMMGRGGIS